MYESQLTSQRIVSIPINHGSGSTNAFRSNGKHQPKWSMSEEENEAPERCGKIATNHLLNLTWAIFSSFILIVAPRDVHPLKWSK